MKKQMTREEWIQELAESDRKLNLTLTNDFAFKKVFRNKKALTGLLSALLEIPVSQIQSLEFPDTVLHGEFEGDREGILDVKVHLNGERKINIEIQVREYPYWEERTLFYLSRMYTEDIQKGDDFSKMEACIHISILGFKHPDRNRLYSVIRLLDQATGKVYSDKMSLRVLYLKQLEHATQEEQKTAVYQWARLISARDWKVLMEMAEKNEYMKETVDEMEKINSDKALRYEYLRREIAELDANTIRNFYTNRGKTAGKAESILDLLEEMGQVPADIRERITSQQDPDILRSWLKLAGRAESIEEFGNGIKSDEEVERT